MSEFLDKAIATGLVAIVIFSALAFGSNEPWSVGLFELGVTGLIMLWAVKVAADRQLKIMVPQAALPLAGLVALGLAQSASTTDGGGQIHSLSMDVEATRGAVTVLIFLLASFIIAANFFVTRERLSSLANVLVIFGMAMSVFALIQHFTWDGHIYWVRPTSFPAFGPFPNRNHFAGYMEMLTPVPLALVLARGARRESWMFYGFASVIMTMTVIVSASRGGIVSLMAGIAFVAAASAARARNYRRAEPGELKPDELKSERARAGRRPLLVLRRFAVALALVVAVTLGVIWIGAEGVINRAAQSLDDMKGGDRQGELFSRTEIWKDSWKMIGAHPITGVGLGAYETIFPIYARHNGMFVVNYAHNDYIQALTDGGLLGGLLAAGFVILILRAVFRGIKSNDPLLRAIAIACGGGIFSILVHSLFDFNLQIPSNALLFLCLSAVVSHIAATADERNREGFINRAASVKAGGYPTGV
jgi:O-antigen ligase